jgi:hypothetical protein
MDVGYKRFLRCARKALRNWFNDWCPTNNASRYKWNKKPNKAQIWYEHAEKFLADNRISNDLGSKATNEEPSLTEE